MIIGRCPSCDAPREQSRPGAFVACFHAKGCTRPAGSAATEGHAEAREWSEQACERDYSEQKARGDFTATYDSHRAPTNPHEDFSLSHGVTRGTPKVGGDA